MIGDPFAIARSTSSCRLIQIAFIPSTGKCTYTLAIMAKLPHILLQHRYGSRNGMTPPRYETIQKLEIFSTWARGPRIVIKSYY